MLPSVQVHHKITGVLGWGGWEGWCPRIQEHTINSQLEGAQYYSGAAEAPDQVYHVKKYFFDQLVLLARKYYAPKAKLAWNRVHIVDWQPGLRLFLFKLLIGWKEWASLWNLRMEYLCTTANWPMKLTHSRPCVSVLMWERFPKIIPTTALTFIGYRWNNLSFLQRVLGSDQYQNTFKQTHTQRNQ